MLYVQLHLEAAPPEPRAPKETEVDWFAEHTEMHTNTDHALSTQVTLPH